jgi:hypothetical protein
VREHVQRLVAAGVRLLRTQSLRTLAVAAALLLASGCSSQPPAREVAKAAPNNGAAASPPQRQPAALRINGSRFVAADGGPFEWRGITAFRLAELIAHGREADAVAYLDWARSQKLTVVRVLLMAKHLFPLSQAEGIKVLPRLLQLAGDRQIYVEAVALADTAEMPLDFQAAVKAVGAVAASHPNAIVEIANEPWHPTQAPFLHDPANVAALASLVPSGVAVALGAIERGDGYAAAGRYATWHSPRSQGDEGWRHVLALADGAALTARWQKPIVSDEPIGAADAYQPGRRDNEPRRFAAAAVVTKLAGLGATFHYEGGLQARVPSGLELACFSAWSSGLDALGAMPPGGEFRKAADLTGIAAASGARALFGRVYASEAWLAAVDPAASMTLKFENGWREAERTTLPGVAVVRLTR